MYRQQHPVNCIIQQSHIPYLDLDVPRRLNSLLGAQRMRTELAYQELKTREKYYVERGHDKGCCNGPS